MITDERIFELAMEASSGIPVEGNDDPTVTYFVPEKLANEICTRFLAAVDAERLNAGSTK